jgi:molecular chaperone GrpE
MTEKNEHNNNLLGKIKESIEGSTEKLARKEKECKDYADRFIRQRAEFENYKKRVEKEKQEYLKFANERLIMELLPIYEHFKLAVENAKQSKDDELMRGFGMILKSFELLLFENGLEKIKAKGNIFDPNLHEVVEVSDSEEAVENTILQEIKEGYILNGKVLVPSKVKIACKKSNLPDEEDSSKDKSEERQENVD